MKFFPYLAFFLLLASCSRNGQNTVSSSKSSSVEQPIDKLNIQMENFEEIDKSGVLMFPLSMGEHEREGKVSYKEMPENGYWNILFLNSNINEYNLLTEKKILILDYNYKYGREEGVHIAKETSHIFYKARISDYNADKLFNEKDPVYLFVSDRYGKNFRQISPDNCDVINWKYIENNSKIILTATKDSNNNKVFDENDEVATFEVILDKQEIPKEIFSNELKQKLKLLFDRDWKRIKQ